jgi:HPt (histidine-containing phosphotransfer) domain-containing protein
VVDREGAGGPSVNATVVARLVEALGPEEVAQVCAVFLVDARELVTAIQGAYESGDADSTAKHAHRLKSASGFLGAEGLSGLCVDIERLARDGRLAELGPHVARLAGEFEHVAAELVDLRR